MAGGRYKEYLLRTELIIIIEANVRPAFRYVPSIEEIWKMPLGKLLERFAKRCDNTELIQRIRAVVEPRNEVAHQSFLLRFDKKGQFEDPEVTHRKLLDLAREILNLPGDVALETAKLKEACPEILSATLGRTT